MAIRSIRRFVPIGAAAMLAACDQQAAAAPEARAPEPVVIASASPASGFTAGGTPVVITGGGLRRVTRVDFGAAAGLQLRVLDDRTIQVMAPPHPAGQVLIRVLDGAGAVGRGTLPFVYTPPDTTDPCAGCWDDPAARLRASAPPPSRSRSAASP